MSKLSDLFKDKPITQSVVAGVICAAGGTVLTLLNKYAPNWFDSVYLGLKGAALVAVLIAALILITRLPKRTVKITPENIETSVRAWLDAFRVGIKTHDDAALLFGLIVTPENGMPIVVGQLKTFKRYIHIQASITISENDKTFFDQLSVRGKNTFAARLNVELARTGMIYRMDLKQNHISLTRRVPIVEDLSEGSFLEALDALDIARTRMLRVLELMLLDASKLLQPEEQAQAALAPAPAPAPQIEGT